MRLGVAAAVVGDRIVPGDVEIEGPTIVSVGLDGGGTGLAIPGFIDVHCHGYGGVDFATAGPDEYRSVAASITSTGVTAFMPSLVSMQLAELVAAIKRHDASGVPEGARLSGLHLEGPFLSQHFPGVHPIETLLEPDLEVAEMLVSAGRVGHMTLAPELSGGLELISWLVERHVTVGVGHTGVDAAGANRAFDLGARSVTHIFNASRPFHHRDPGIVGVALTRRGVLVEAILDGVHLSDEASTLVIAAVGDDLIAATDSMAAAGSGDGTYRLGDHTVTVSNGEARMADGTIASSVLTMDRAFRNLIGLGVGVVAASRATSTAPARLLGHNEFGTLNPGTPADVVILDDDFRVIETLVNGQVRHSAR